jgi:hypothetical protein
MEKPRTRKELHDVIKRQLQNVSEYTTTKSLEIENQQNFYYNMTALYSYAQYLERKSFEMKMYIEEYTLGVTSRIESLSHGKNGPDEPPF